MPYLSPIVTCTAIFLSLSLYNTVSAHHQQKQKAGAAAGARPAAFFENFWGGKVPTSRSVDGHIN